MLEREMTLVQAEAEPSEGADRAIRMNWDGGSIEVDAVLVAVGRRPALDDLGLEALGHPLGKDGQPDLPEGRLNLPGTRLYFAGDVGSGPALLHEASDEGRIAGHFAARDADAEFRRRTPLRMVFCSPQLALAGADWDALQTREGPVARGEAAFDGVGRTRLQRGPGGAIHIHADSRTGQLLGAAILGPEAEHLGHLLAYAIERGEDLRGLLRMPAYHPTHEEVLRRALRAALDDSEVTAEPLEAIRCEDSPIDCEEARARD
ncbi:MAG: FAD-dependent oxidoreductase [Paracoccaceae bacterium]